jgi:hypothetical protein
VSPELWLRDPWFVLFSFLPVPLGVAWMLLGPRLPLAREPRGAAWLAALTWIVTRAAFALLLWGVLGHLSVDLLGFFVPQAERAAAGALPYRDFATAHSPLFPFVLAAGFLVAGPVGIAVLFVLADLGAWTMLVVRDRRHGVSATRGSGWLYLTFPPTWYFTVRYSQDEPLSALCIAGALVALERRAEVTAGAWMAAGLLATKSLFGLAALPLALAPGTGRRRRWLALLLPVAAVNGAMAALGAPIARPLTLLQADSFSHGPSLWRIPFVWYGVDLGAWGWLPMVVVLATGAWWLRRQGASPLAHAAWIYGSFALLTPRGYPMYVVIWAPLLAVWVAAERRARLWWWAAYGLLLPLSFYLDSGPLSGLFGDAVRWLAAAGMAATAAAALWPMAQSLLEHRSSPSAAPASGVAPRSGS